MSTGYFGFWRVGRKVEEEEATEKNDGVEKGEDDEEFKRERGENVVWSDRWSRKVRS